jgi:hypothetical protein
MPGVHNCGFAVREAVRTELPSAAKPYDCQPLITSFSIELPSRRRREPADPRVVHASRTGTWAAGTLNPGTPPGNTHSLLILSEPSQEDYGVDRPDLSLRLS